MVITILQETTKKGLTAKELYETGKMPSMMQHWYSIRQQYPEDFLIAYRMGDFYEFFFEDAINVSKLLGLTLTKRGSGISRHPLAGIPHKATQHFKALVNQGKTVVIVEQLENPSEAKKDNRIVKRGVVRVLSPGTVIDDELLDSKSANFVASIYREKKNYGIAFLDVSSGQFFTIEYYGIKNFRQLWSSLARFDPVECVLPQELLADPQFMSELRENFDIILKEQPQYQFLYQNAYKNLIEHFKVKNLNGFDLEGKEQAICAAGGILSFVKESQKQEGIENIREIKYIHDEDYMFLDVTTQQNLELIHNMRDGGDYGTLFDILDETNTPMGTRLLKEWIMQPLIKKENIENRLEIVDYFRKNIEKRQGLQEIFRQMGDIERLISRINYSSTVNARNLLQLQEGLRMIHETANLLKTESHELINEITGNLKDFREIIELIERSIHKNPPITITEGNIIKDGYNDLVDEYRDILKNGKNWILKFEEEEKEALQVKTGLKIGYNRVLGYYIQITNHALSELGTNLPEEYIQRQSLKNAVRYETPRLKDMETKILSAETNLMDLEYNLFQEIREKILRYTLEIQENAELIAQLDVLGAFAEIAHNFNYTRPKVENHDKIIIKQGRHPVVEQLNEERFVPNDLYMNREEEQILIITGPNWSGKSTYLRQTALIVLMAQIGSFVPANSAEIGIIDRIFTRVGASDDLTRGQSTFMLEMNEMAQILNYTTSKSLIIIDELGRGTGTLDGESIAQAVIEYLHDLGVKTLFSTHFHQLTEIQLPRIHNYHFKIIEKPESRKLIFLRQLTDGGTDKSYGIHVGMMAGLPKKVTDRAFTLMENVTNCQSNLEKRNHLEGSSSKLSTTMNNSQNPKTRLKQTIKQKTIQTSLFPIQKYDDSELIIKLRSLDINHLTPLQAFEVLVQLKKKAMDGEH